MSRLFPASPSSLALLLLGLVASVASGCRDKDSPTSQGDASGATDAAPGLPLPPPLQVTEAACGLKTERFLPLVELPIKASGTTPPFAKIGTSAMLGTTSATRRFPRAELGITSDEDLPFLLRVVGSAEIKGFVPRSFPVHPGSPIAFGKFAAALPHTSLRVVRATMAEVEVEAELGTTVESLEGPLRARGPCGLFAIERREFAATSVIPGVSWKNTADAMLKKGRKIPLTTLPLGTPSANILLGPDDNANISVFEKDHGRAHIAWLGGSVIVHGWIADTEIVPLPKTDAGAAPAASASASPSPSASASPSASPSASFTCAEAVPLVVQTGESRTTVGTLRAAGAFEVVARDKGWAEVRVDVPLFVLEAGSRLLVRETDIAACKPKKENAR